MFKFFILLIFNLIDTINVPYFKNVRVSLDGRLNEIYYKTACKITNLIETYPVPFQTPPESTVIYLFQTDEGLYLGFHCITKNRKPDKSVTGDEILIFLDTDFDRENAYMFGIGANGEKKDARVIGGVFDYSEDFLWNGEVYCADNYYEAEIFIPWKGLIGKKGKWGIDIVRKGPGHTYEVRLSPFDPKKDKFHVSRFKVIKMINFKPKAITLELQPILLLHHGEDFGEKYNYKYDIGFNTYLKFKKNLKIAFTYNPDFGDVEADPFRLNLTKYPLYYAETRPFFTEGSEFFKLSGFYPLKVFYSRQIGKTTLSGKIIPILFAEKFFIKSNYIEFSLLHAQTEEIQDIYEKVPQTHFIVNKIKFIPEKNISMSVLTAYRFPSREKPKGLIGTQIFYNDSLTTLDIEGVFDNHVSHDFAQKIKFIKIIKKFRISTSLLSIPDSFSDNEVGFIPWKGEKDLNFEISSPVFINKKGILYITPSLGLDYFKELGEPYVFNTYSRINLTFKNLTFLSFTGGYGKNFEMGKKFETPIISLYIGNLLKKMTKNKFTLYLSAYCKKIYNYQRNYIGFLNTNSIEALLNIKNLTIITGIYQWNEFNNENKLDVTTYSWHSKLILSLPYRVSIYFYCDAPIRDSKINQERIGIFFSYNISGKNYIKAIYNDYRIKNNGSFYPLIRKGTIKIINSTFFEI